MSDRQQIKDRAGVGDNQTHSKTQSFQAFSLAFRVVQRVLNPDTMSLEKTVELETGLDS
ncbi:MAG TPA: hypothetical protein VKT81_13815 [Bryobacteraceae bacterium]|nr:hypothetical protein [Bryobacteraceae bacterium]